MTSGRRRPAAALARFPVNATKGRWNGRVSKPLLQAVAIYRGAQMRVKSLSLALAGPTFMGKAKAGPASGRGAVPGGS